jgi:hypothetical protein
MGQGFVAISDTHVTSEEQLGIQSGQSARGETGGGGVTILLRTNRVEYFSSVCCLFFYFLFDGRRVGVKSGCV